MRIRLLFAKIEVWLFINIIVQSILNIKTMDWQDDLVGKGTCHQT